MYDIIFRFT